MKEPGMPRDDTGSHDDPASDIPEPDEVEDISVHSKSEALENFWAEVEMERKLKEKAVEEKKPAQASGAPQGGKKIQLKENPFADWPEDKFQYEEINNLFYDNRRELLSLLLEFEKANIDKEISWEEFIKDKPVDFLDSFNQEILNMSDKDKPKAQEIIEKLTENFKLEAKTLIWFSLVDFRKKIKAETVSNQPEADSNIEKVEELIGEEGQELKTALDSEELRNAEIFKDMAERDLSEFFTKYYELRRRGKLEKAADAQEFFEKNFPKSEGYNEGVYRIAVQLEIISGELNTDVIGYILEKKRLEKIYADLSSEKAFLFTNVSNVGNTFGEFEINYGKPKGKIEKDLSPFYDLQMLKEAYASKGRDYRKEPDYQEEAIKIDESLGLKNESAECLEDVERLEAKLAEINEKYKQIAGYELTKFKNKDFLYAESDEEVKRTLEFFAENDLGQSVQEIYFSKGRVILESNLATRKEHNNEVQRKIDSFYELSQNFKFIEEAETLSVDQIQDMEGFLERIKLFAKKAQIFCDNKIRLLEEKEGNEVAIDNWNSYKNGLTELITLTDFQQIKENNNYKRLVDESVEASSKVKASNIREDLESLLEVQLHDNNLATREDDKIFDHDKDDVLQIIKGANELSPGEILNNNSVNRLLSIRSRKLHENNDDEERFKIIADEIKVLNKEFAVFEFKAKMINIINEELEIIADQKYEYADSDNMDQAKRDKITIELEGIRELSPHLFYTSDVMSYLITYMHKAYQVRGPINDAKEKELADFGKQMASMDLVASKPLNLGAGDFF